jgi:hypothetical protein
MHSEPKQRPQNQRPQALIQSRRELAMQNYEAVRLAVQAMRRRGTPVREITVQSVAREAGVSGATLYRRDDLFALLQKANPDLQRRHAEQVHSIHLLDLQADLAEAQKDKDYYKKEAELAKIGAQGLRQEITQLRKKYLDLERKIVQLEHQMQNCTCGAQKPAWSSLKKE